MKFYKPSKKLKEQNSFDNNSEDVDQLARLSIRQVKHSDLLSLEWEGEFSHYRRLFHDVYQSSLRGTALMWIAELPVAGVIGQVFVQLMSERMELADGWNRAYIFSFRVRTPYRSKGVGSRLLSALEDDLRSRGYQWAVLNVNQDNTAARKFYERWGYRVVGEEEGRWAYIDQNGIKQNVHEPAWRMEKHL